MAGLAADGGEAPADVDGRARDGKGVDLAVRVGDERRIHGAVGQDVGDVLAGEAAHRSEEAADVETTATVGDHRMHDALHQWERLLAGAACLVESDAAARGRADVGELAADVGGPVGRGGECIDVAVGDPGLLVRRGAERRSGRNASGAVSKRAA